EHHTLVGRVRTRSDRRDQNVAMSHQLIARRKLIFGNLSDNVGSGTVVDHFRLSPDVRVGRSLMIHSNLGNTLGTLFAAARYAPLLVGADLDVKTGPEIVFRFAVTTFVDRFHH